MIELYVLDVDGCISIPFQEPDWSAIEKIRNLNAASKTNPTIPPITLCTGRPQPYAECVAQWLGIQLPFIFESGGGMYQMGSNKLQFNPVIDQQAIQKVEKLKAKIEAEIIPAYPEAYQEFTKHTDCGLVHPDSLAIRTIMPKMQRLMEELQMHVISRLLLYH